jgi:hypothetical protein
MLSSLGLTLQGLREALSKLPEPENRDWMMQAQESVGLSPVTDPSAHDLAAVVTEKVLPGGTRNLTTKPTVAIPTGVPVAAESSGRDEPLSDEALDLAVVDKQLRVFQFVVATLAGALVGGQVMAAAGAAVGFLAGCIVAAIRDHRLGAVAGVTAGILHAQVYERGEVWITLLGGMLGFALGACLGDWRKLRAPPGSG